MSFSEGQEEENKCEKYSLTTSAGFVSSLIRIPWELSSPEIEFCFFLSDAAEWNNLVFCPQRISSLHVKFLRFNNLSVSSDKTEFYQECVFFFNMNE